MLTYHHHQQHQHRSRHHLPHVHLSSLEVQWHSQMAGSRSSAVNTGRFSEISKSPIFWSSTFIATKRVEPAARTTFFSWLFLGLLSPFSHWSWGKRGRLKFSSRLDLFFFIIILLIDISSHFGQVSLIARHHQNTHYFVFKRVTISLRFPYERYLSVWCLLLGLQNILANVHGKKTNQEQA